MGMHVDSGNTHFWLYLLSGRKQWRFYSSMDVINLYQAGSHFYPDVFRPQPEFFPLLKYAVLYEGVQEPGDLVFIPAGNPHGVRNLDHIHGVSMNYVDASNIWMYILDAVEEENYPAVELFTDNATFTQGLRSGQEALRWGEWKSQRWNKLSYDLL